MFLVGSLRFCVLIASCPQVQLCVLLLTCIPSTSFSCLIVLARTFSALLNKSGRSRQPCLIPYLEEKIQLFTGLSEVLAVGCTCGLTVLRYIPLYPLCLGSCVCHLTELTSVGRFLQIFKGFLYVGLCHLQQRLSSLFSTLNVFHVSFNLIALLLSLQSYSDSSFQLIFSFP